MATQLQTIRTEILETAGLASDDPRFPDATLNRIINRALRALSAEHDWPWMEASETITTAANDAEYSPAADWAETKRLRYEDRDLQQYQAADAQQYANDTGEPVGFYIEEDLIHIVPVPDGVYPIEHIYYSYVTALSGDTDTPALPDRYVDYLVWHALKQVAARIRDEKLYGMADNETRDWYRRASDEVRRSNKSVPIKTRSDWWIG